MKSHGKLVLISLLPIAISVRKIKFTTFLSYRRLCKMAASKSKIAEVRLNMHQLTSKSRLYITKAGAVTKNKIEEMDFDTFTKEFKADNCESRNRPNYGLQELAHTLLCAKPVFEEMTEQGLFGPGIALLLKAGNYPSVLVSMNLET